MQYYWKLKQGVLTHTQIDGERADPFFNTVSEAETFLENRADANGNDQYNGAVLWDTDGNRIKEATEVLTTEAKLGQFMADD